MTEEQKKSLQQFVDTRPYYGTCTIEYKEGIEDGALWQASQPNPNRIRVWHTRELEQMLHNEQISYSRMVEILNEIAAGKHKEKIEI
jgi:hypothetical protein